MAHSQYFYFNYSVSMDKLQVVFSCIRNLSASNNKMEEGENVIMYIRNNYKSIKEETSKERSAKRRTFGKCERRLVDDFVEICNYRCDIQNRRFVNEIMSLLEYGGYDDKKPRFRQRMENIMKKMRRSNKAVRPSNRNLSSEERHPIYLHNQVSLGSDSEVEADKCYVANGLVDPLLNCNRETIVNGLIVDSVSEPSEAVDDNDLYIFYDDILNWKEAGLIKENKESPSDIQALLDQNKENDKNLREDTSLDEGEYKCIFNEGLF